MCQVFMKGIVFITLLVMLWLTGAFEAAKARTSFTNPLADTSWYLVEFQSMDDSIGAIQPKSPSLYSLQLNDDGTVAMRLNCNSARGQWSVDSSGEGDSGRFEFGPLATTDTICPLPSMDQKIVADAQHIRGYLLKNDKLYLSLKADAGIYVWERENKGTRLTGPPASPEDGGPRNWEVDVAISGLNLREYPGVKAQVLTTYHPGTTLDNLGCEKSEGRFWCYVQQFGGGPVGYVAAEFLKPAVSPNGQTMTGPDDSPLLAGYRIFDATGTIPCAQYQGQPMLQCSFGVARAGGGYATVVVNRPDTIRRAIFFRMGKPTGADVSEADGYPEFSASKEKDLNIIHVGHERYEIPDAVIYGD